jgi:hypothetical protein
VLMDADLGPELLDRLASLMQIDEEWTDRRE